MQSVSAMVQTFVLGLQPGSLDGMLNAMRFVVPTGGGFALEALTACRNVQPAPHVDPSVSAVDVTVKVIAGVAVGVGVGVASGLSLVINAGEVTATPLIFRWENCGLKLAASNTADAETNAAIKTIRSAKARGESFFFIFCCG